MTVNKLSRETDRLNAAFDMVEEAFCLTYTGVCASVPMPDGSSLSFGKHQNEWGLYIVTSTSSNHVTSAPRGVRVTAAKLVRELGKHLKADFEAQADEISNLADDLANYARELTERRQQ